MWGEVIGEEWGQDSPVTSGDPRHRKVTVPVGEGGWLEEEGLLDTFKLG